MSGCIWEMIQDYVTVEWNVYRGLYVIRLAVLFPVILNDS